MKVIIVEDDPVSAGQLKDYLKRYAGESGVEFEAAHYTDAEAFLRNYKKENPAIVFFDIELPNIDGMEAARQLRERDSAVVIVFVTKMVQYAIKGYEVNALNFLVKPVPYAEFRLKMSRAVNVARANEAKDLYVPMDSGFYRVPSDSIVFVEVEGHRLKYQLVDGVVEARGSLSDVQEKLAGHGFLRCNSCYVVNVKYIDSVKGYDLHINGYTLKISHPRRKEFMRQLMDLYTGGFGKKQTGGG